MTITTTSSRMEPYEGNGAATAFPITFPFPADSTIRAILERPDENDVDLVLDTDFTLIGAGDPAGGTLTFPKAGSAYSTLAAGEYLYIMRVVPLTQERDWDNVDALDAEQIEAGDDRLTMIGQQLQEQLDRALVWPVTTDPEDLDTDPEGFVTAAQAAQNAAEAAQGLAEDARDAAAATAAAVDASLAAGVAAATADAAAARDDAQAAQAAAESARDEAQTAAAAVGVLAGNTTVNLTPAMTAAEMQAAINVLPRDLAGYTLTVQFADGTYNTGMTAALSFKGFHNGTLNIYGNTSETNATALHTTHQVFLDFSAETSSGLYFRDCTCSITVRNLKIKAADASSASCIAVYGCAFFQAMYCYFLGTGTNFASGVRVFNGGRGYVSVTYVSTLNIGLYCMHSVMSSYQNDDTGTPPVYGLAANFGTIHKSSTQPAGSTANEITSNGGQII